MVPLFSLWLPILLAAVLIFLASSVMHMVLKYHHNDARALPDEEGVMAALRPFNLPPGDYLMPKPATMQAMGTPEYTAKMAQGPVGVFTIFPNGPAFMGAALAQWFVYLVLVSVCAAYVAGRALGPGAGYLEVFRFAGVTAFLGYGAALWQDTIWWKKSALTSIKNTVDALIYALLTAGVFGWLWPN